MPTSTTIPETASELLTLREAASEPRVVVLLFGVCAAHIVKYTKRLIAGFCRYIEKGLNLEENKVCASELGH